MLISYNWLKEYVDIKFPPEKLAEILTMSGCAAESVRASGCDHILELEVTANRPDLLSVIGIAREVAALTGKKLKGRLLTRPNIKDQKPNTEDRIKIRVEDKTLCPRYTARIIRGVRVAESPVWLKERIEAMGLRPVNNVVDITNFCLFETGEPMHAFDLDKIASGEIIVRRAAKNEKITTIEGSTKILKESDLVIADGKGPVALAGVMGGSATEVTHATKNILLEAAYFDPVSVRRTAASFGIATESSYRFERRVDIDSIRPSSDRAASLIAELAGGIIGELIDVGLKKLPERHIELRFNRLDRLLGGKVSVHKTKRILESLGLPTRAPSNEKAKFKVPGYRPDLNCEADLIEEVARVYGYDKIAPTIPQIPAQPVRTSREIEIARILCGCLTGLGISEIISYSLLSKKAVTIAGYALDGIVEIRNPLSTEQEVMRPGLMPGMLGSILWNLNRKIKDLKFFELGNVYEKTGIDAFREKKHLCIGMTGHASAGWSARETSVGFFDLKGALETVFSELGVEGISFRCVKDSRFSSSECAAIEMSGRTVGIMGLVDDKVLDGFDIKERVYLLEIDVDASTKDARLEKHFVRLPKYPSVFRDISIVVDIGASNADIIEAIKAAAQPLLKEAKLIDKYTGRQIPDGKTGLTYRLEYQDPARTLEEKDILEIHSNVLRSLEEKFGAKLR